MGRVRLGVFTVLAAAALGLIGLAIFGALNAGASTVPKLDVTVTDGGSAPPDSVDLSGMTYNEAATALSGQVADPGSVTLPIAPAGFRASSSGAALYFGNTTASQYSVAIEGTTEVLGKNADMLVTAVWKDADTDAAPRTAVLFSFGAASLGDFAGFNDFPVHLTKSWAAISAGSHTTVDPADLPSGVSAFFDDGLSSTDDSFHLGDGITFRGVLDASGTVIADAASKFGLSDSARLDGVLSTDISVLDGSGAPSANAGLDLTATLPTMGSGSALPDWLAPSGDWTLGFHADSDGTVTGGLSGGADVDAAGASHPVSLAVAVTYDGSEASFSLSATVGDLPDLFGTTWLDLTDVGVDATISTAGTFSGGLTARMDLQDLTGQNAFATVTLHLDAGSDGASGSIAITTDATASLSSLAETLGASSVPDKLAVTVNGFSLFVGFDDTGSSPALTIATTTNATVHINNATIDSDILFRLTTGDETKFLFAVKPDAKANAVSVGQLLGASFGSADITLPKFTINVSNADWNVPADELDAPTATYLGPDSDLKVDKGVTIDAGVSLPQTLKDALGTIGISTTGDLVLEGKLPVLGGTDLGIAIKFPAISASPFEDAALQLDFTKASTGFEMGIDGEATVEVPNSETSGKDKLTFNVSAKIKINAGNVSFQLAGGLTSGDDTGWQDPFGVQGLTVYSLRLEVGVETTPELAATVGISAHLSVASVNPADKPDDVLVAFKLGITPEPPFLEPIGFTFAANSLDLPHLAGLEQMVTGKHIDTSALPNIWVKDVFVSFGTEDDAPLCIRQGFYLTGELHLGGTPSGSIATNCTPPPIDPPAKTAACANDSTCLAAILLNIDTGVATGTPSFSAAGYFAQTDLGPLHFDPTKIELKLTPDLSKNRLYVSGGASLDDPTGATNTTWVSGTFTLDLTLTKLKLDAEVDLAGGKALHAKLTGEADLDLIHPHFTVHLEFHSDLLDHVAGQIDHGINQLVNDVQSFYQLLRSARSDSSGSVNLWRNLEVLLQQDGSAPGWLVNLVDSFASVQDTVDQINQTFTDAGLPAPIAAAELEHIVLEGYDIRFGGVPSTYVKIFGHRFCLGDETDGGCWLIPPISWHIPGVCDAPGFAGGFHDFLCTDLSAPKVVGKLFENQLSNDLGLQLPNEDGGAILDDLGTQLTGSGVNATCGYATADYANGTISPSELTLDVAGDKVVVETPLDLVGDSGFDPQGKSLQNVFDVLVGSAAPSADHCTTTSQPTPPAHASITLAASPTTLTEGETVSASGIADVDNATSVDITWGDGASSSATIGTDGAFSATHTYADDIGVGTSTSYTIEASAGSAAAATRVTVTNVAPSITSAKLTPDTIDEGGSTSLAVHFTDPGVKDGHTVTVVWSDGVRQTHDVAAGVLSDTFTRTVVDDNPTGTPSDEMTADVTVQDKDGGTAVDTNAATLTIDNVAPTDLQLTPIQPDGTPTTVPVNEGDTVRFRVGFTDVGVHDSETVTVDWADGNTDTLFVPATGKADRSIDVVHTYVDDNPTGTPQDTYPVKVTVTDDDTGTASATLPIVVHNVAPSITSLTVTPKTVDENAGPVTLDMAFTDPGVNDSHTVTIDWGAGWSDGNTKGTAAEGQDARYTVVHIPAGDPRSVEATNRYGDNGTYRIGVTVTDDDTGSTSDTTHTVTVANVAPTHHINNGAGDGYVTTDWGGQVLIAGEGDRVQLSDSATDPGSDDLTFGWQFGDGQGTSHTSLVGVPTVGVVDPSRSPQVAPRGVTDNAAHSYRDACLYGASAGVTDDDGGDGGTDSVAIAIQRARGAGDRTARNFGQWKSAIISGAISSAQLNCYLDEAGYLSGVFLGPSENAGKVWAPAHGIVDATALDAKGVPLVLADDAGGGDKLHSEQVKLDRALLSAWLDFADGAWGWNTPIEDTNGDGVLDTSFHQVMAEVEQVRLTSTNSKAVSVARQRLWPLGVS